MNEKEKKEYMKGYARAKKKGVPFYPDILFKDAVISLIIFLALVALAYFIGAPLEERADPSDNNYTPRPEWYFLFLFQLLKYFPGNLEVIGVVVLPTLAIIFLFLLPLLDRKSKRHFQSRPVIIGGTALIVIGIGFLSIQSYLETPPPAEAAEGDQTAVLYTQNCAGCHGASITVAPTTNLHEVITQGQHEDMPAWSGDLTTDEVDALAGFILSPKGSEIFTQNCSECHEAPELVAGDPLELKSALDLGPDYPGHIGLEVPNWTQVMEQADSTALINFLVAPDGQRLFTVNCAPCHGYSVGFSGDKSELISIINQGGMHLDMPAWKETLSTSEIDRLASYVVNPDSTPEGQALFQQYCSTCHGERIPTAADEQTAQEIITGGGSHQTMPVWGDILTSEQIDALVSYTLESAQGSSLQVGQELYAANCALCHGEFGEGGLNPARPDDIIAPISSAEYLQTRDDFTLRTIITQGQPNFGMSPFGSSVGGPLDDDDIDAIVAYLRSWEQNPPVELPPEIIQQDLSLEGAEIYATLCTQCHGEKGEGGIGPALSNPQFQEKSTDEDIYNAINLGHNDTSMIAWGKILDPQQIQELVNLIRQMEPVDTTPTTQETPSVLAPTFASDILPIFQKKCNVCHGTLGGWDGTNYESAINSGDNGPAVIPGDPDNSLLVQKLLGTQTTGLIMPPGSKLTDSEIQLIIDWILAGAPQG